MLTAQSRYALDIMLTSPANTQKSHLHEILSPIKPATIGPSAGPANGATVNKARAFPLVPASQISEIKALKVKGE